MLWARNFWLRLFSILFLLTRCLCMILPPEENLRNNTEQAIELTNTVPAVDNNNINNNIITTTTATALTAATTTTTTATTTIKTIDTTTALLSTSSPPPATLITTSVPIAVQGGATTHPSDCSQREKLKKQPTYSETARLKKCCPLGESLDIFRENQSDSICDTSNQSFEPDVISAVLYDNCIEDEEIQPRLPMEIGNPCNTSFLYDDMEDAFFVLQNGALLIIDKFGNDSYTVEQNYCIDMDKSGQMFAITCITQVEVQLARGQMITVAVLMLVSMPCLLIVSYLHISLRSLRTLNGLSLSLMSLCLAAGYFVHSVVHLYNIPSSGFIGYVIQFCILSYFFWFFCLCSNVVVNIWYKLPRHVQLTRSMAYVNFAIYFLFAFSGPAILVSLTVQKGLQGTPSYFVQGLTESIRESQRYFIPPVTTILCLSFLVMIFSFFGFQRIKNNGYLLAEKDEQTELAIPRVSTQFDQQKYEEVKKDAKCISLLGVIMIVTWLLEIVTFYSPGPEGYLILCDMINGLQGVFVLLIFLVVRRRRTIILRWWYDRGSHSIEGTELRPMTK